MAQIAADQAEAKASGGKWVDIGARKSEESDSESDSDTQSTTEDGEVSSTKTGTALYHGLLDRPEILRNVFSSFNNKDLILYSLASKECARRIEYLVPADDKRWEYRDGQTRKGLLNMLNRMTDWFRHNEYCSRCRFMTTHGYQQYEYEDWCDACLYFYGDKEVPICGKCQNRGPNQMTLGFLCDECVRKSDEGEDESETEKEDDEEEEDEEEVEENGDKEEHEAEAEDEE